MRTSNELQIGKAGEYIVCADLIMKGFVAFPSEQGLPYDVLLDIGHRILRVQVKTTSCPRKVQQRVGANMAYIFNIKRAGRGGSARLLESDVDLFALVCLDTRKVGYLLPQNMPTTINIRVDSMRGNYYDEKGIRDYKNAILHKGQLSQTAIAKKLNIHVASVNRMFRKGFRPYESEARYFSDFERSREWFSKL